MTEKAGVLLLGLVVELVVNGAAKMLLKGEWHKDLNGSPYYSWVVGLVHQAVVFPSFGIGILLPAMRDPELLRSTWDDAPFACLLFHATILGYWLKDCALVSMNTETWVHHLACSACVAASLSGNLVRSACSTSLIGITLEIGSCVNSLSELRPRYRAPCTPIMAASNLAAVALNFWYAATFSRYGGPIGRWTTCLVCTLVAIGRQIVWHKTLRRQKNL